MSRYGSEKRQMQRDYLTLRDGYKCKVGLCKEDPKGSAGAVAGEPKLFVEHIDGDPRHNAWPNLRLSCGSCNQKERYRLKALESKNSSGLRGGEVGTPKSSLPTSPAPDYTAKRSEQIKYGLIRFLGDVAMRATPIMTEDEIIVNAPAYIDHENPPSESAVRRWLHMYSNSIYYPYRFDKLRRLYWDEPKEIEQGDVKE